MTGLTTNYLASMQAHVDEGGTLSHANGIELLKEVQRLRQLLLAEEDEPCHGPEDTTCAVCGLGGKVT